MMSHERALAAGVTCGEENCLEPAVVAVPGTFAVNRWESVPVMALLCQAHADDHDDVGPFKED